MIKHCIRVGKIYLFSSYRSEQNCNLRFRPLSHLPWTRHQHPSFRSFNLLISWERDVSSEWVFAGSWRLHPMQRYGGLGGWVFQVGILGGRLCCFPCLGLKWVWLGHWVLQGGRGRSCFVPCLAWKVHSWSNHHYCLAWKSNLILSCLERRKTWRRHELWDQSATWLLPLLD